MKVTKRKTVIKCLICKSSIIGYKYPPKIEGFSCHIEMNENSSNDSVRFVMDGKRYITRVCKNCENKLKN